MIYNELIPSKLDYVSLKCGSASQSTLRSLDLFHNCWLRQCSGAIKCLSMLQKQWAHFITRLRPICVLKITSTDSSTNEWFDMQDIATNDHDPPFPIRANRLLTFTAIRVNLHLCSTAMDEEKMLNLTIYQRNKIILQRYSLEHIESKDPH